MCVVKFKLSCTVAKWLAPSLTHCYFKLTLHVFLEPALKSESANSAKSPSSESALTFLLMKILNVHLPDFLQE